MAWANIDERRARVAEMAKRGIHKSIIKKVCSVEFGCSPAAIVADLHTLNGNVANLSPKIRQIIRDRDNYTCQYCGLQNPYSGIIEHIIPVSKGGSNKPHNLVFACQRCNTEKKNKVWVPDNLDGITINQPQWREFVKLMARNN
jgi:hypothetical protein